jgi:hypothetical protein
MRPAVLIPILVFAVLCLGAAWVEYSQHSGLMLQSASGDLAQLCTDLKSARVCPQTPRFKTREAKDPWSHAYQCRSTPRGLLIYTLGADEQVGGTQRDADIVCTNASLDGEDNELCSCAVGETASALVR